MKIALLDLGRRLGIAWTFRGRRHAIAITLPFQVRR